MLCETKKENGNYVHINRHFFIGCEKLYDTVIFSPE